MADLTTTYLGLQLANPIIVGSSGLTNSADAIAKCAEAGAGAVVVKSIFEEQIAAEVMEAVDASHDSMWHPEAAEYIGNYGRENAVGAFLETIADAKRRVDIPVIASVHCVSAGRWTEFAGRMQKAGADAIELNVFVLPSDPRRSGADNEQVPVDVVRAVKANAQVPVAAKVGFYYSSLVRALGAIADAGADGLVLFNRFYSPDFDLDALEIKPAPITSTPDEHTTALRWISILAGRVGCDLAASTGIHDGAAVVKQLLAGARAVQVASALYKHGVEHIGPMLKDIEAFMDAKGFGCLDDFRGKLSQKTSANPAVYDRVQFMKTSVGIE